MRLACAPRSPSSPVLPSGDSAGQRSFLMSITAREAFEKGTDTFNAHDVVGFGEVLAADVVFEAPGGMRGKGKAACVAFYSSWFSAFPYAHVEVHGLHIIDD